MAVFLCKFNRFENSHTPKLCKGTILTNPKKCCIIGLSVKDRRPEAMDKGLTIFRKEKDMGRKKKAKYDESLCGKMYRYFLGYDDRGLPSFTKFAISVGLSRDDIERFRKHRRFEAAYRECKEIRMDYLIDRALDKRFDGSFVKFLISCESDGEAGGDSGEISLNLRVIE